MLGAFIVFGKFWVNQMEHKMNLAEQRNLSPKFEGYQDGFSMRLNNVFSHPDGKALVLGIDHTLFDGFISGLDDIPRLFAQLPVDSMDAVLASPVTYRRAKMGALSKKLGKVMRIDTTDAFHSGSARNVLASTVASDTEIVRSGVDAVTCFFLINGEGNRIGDYSSHVADISRMCRNYGYPLIVEALCVDDNGDTIRDTKLILYAARMASELGADVLKIDAPADQEDLRDVVLAMDRPVLIRGGTPKDDRASMLREVEGFVEAGASGIVFGRTVFQAGDPAGMIKDLYKALHGQAS